MRAAKPTTMPDPTMELAMPPPDAPTGAGSLVKKSQTDGAQGPAM